MSCVSAVGMCADSGTRRMHADNVQELKCADNAQGRDSEAQAEDVWLRAGGLTAIERMRGERV